MRTRRSPRNQERMFRYLFPRPEAAEVQGFTERVLARIGESMRAALEADQGELLSWYCDGRRTMLRIQRLRVPAKRRALWTN